MRTDASLDELGPVDHVIGHVESTTKEFYDG
jgi:hypothetical protein